MMSQKTGKFVCYGARRRELSIFLLKNNMADQEARETRFIAIENNL
jgi:hypothetical protein